ncbi:MAG: chemotaxis protein [Proteobacteria bacterium]|nr:chemotaxis protein [Pseudomonadota bacterium]MBU1611438.1 chemotaxis protein [Pseudomonadota bacterium]
MAGHEILLETGTNEVELIEFYLDEAAEHGVDRHYFGANVAKVLEVIEAPVGMEVEPSASHPSFLGTIALRDLILPVVDLAVWLRAKRQPSDHELIVVTEFNNAVTGFLVSGVTQIHRLGWKDIEPPGRAISTLDESCITGTVRMGERFTLILDLELALAELGGVEGGGEVPHLETADATGAMIFAPKEEKYRVIVADDSRSVRALLRHRLEEAGFEVETFMDGAAAWDCLKGLKARAVDRGESVDTYLDAVVSDVEMPRMDGYTLTRRIKEDSVLSVLPVVLFSSIISKGLEHKGWAVKADDQVTKPGFDKLPERVLTLLRKRDGIVEKEA